MHQGRVPDGRHRFSFRGKLLGHNRAAGVLNRIGSESGYGAHRCGCPMAVGLQKLIFAGFVSARPKMSGCIDNNRCESRSGFVVFNDRGGESGSQTRDSGRSGRSFEESRRPCELLRLDRRFAGDGNNHEPDTPRGELRGEVGDSFDRRVFSGATENQRIHIGPVEKPAVMADVGFFASGAPPSEQGVEHRRTQKTGDGRSLLE